MLRNTFTKWVRTAVHNMYRTSNINKTYGVDSDSRNGNETKTKKDINLIPKYEKITYQREFLCQFGEMFISGTRYFEYDE